MKVAALTSGQVVPSSRFRVRQHILPLQEKGIFVKEFAPLRDKYSTPPKFLFDFMYSRGRDPYYLWRKIKMLRRFPSAFIADYYDIVWLERILVPGMLTHELKFKKPLVFDLDDAIWMGEGEGFTQKIVEKASLVFAGNQFLADWCSQFTQKVHIIPTAVKVLPRSFSAKTEKDKTIIGWIGTSSNLNYLKLILPSLKIILSKNKNVSLLICSDKPPDLQGLNLDFLEWSIDSEKTFFNTIDIGIMPLEDSEWIKGKCSYKMLQYLGHGIPAIVSGVGMNVQVANELGIGVCANSDNEWIEKIEKCLNEEDYYNTISEKGMALVKERYSTEVISSRIENLFRKLA